MACNPANLTPLLYISPAANGHVIWDYSTTDNVSAVDAYGYFSPAFKQLRGGDIVRATANDGKALYWVDGANYTSGSEFVGVIKTAVCSSFV